MNCLLEVRKSLVGADKLKKQLTIYEKYKMIDKNKLLVQIKFVGWLNSVLCQVKYFFADLFTKNTLIAVNKNHQNV